MGKRLSAFFIVLCIFALGLPASQTHAAAVTTASAEKLSTLQGLGVWAGTTANLDAVVTRGEFMALADLLYNIPLDETENVYFKDVPVSHTYHAAISAAAARGLINGDGTNFEPDRAIMPEEALKIMLSAQGYAPYVAEKGGYPTGYIKCAAEIGLTSGTGLGDQLTYQDIVTLFYNAIDTDALVPESIGEEVTYSYINMMEEFHNIYAITGQVTATYDTALYSGSELSKDRVRIDETEFDAKYSLVSKFLGVKVNAWYHKYEDKNNAIVYMCSAPGVRTLTVNTEDIQSFADFSLKYYNENGNLGTANLSGTAAVIYNGQAITDPADFTQELMVPKNGTVTLIDNGQGYQVAKIMDYETFVISGVSQNTERFYDKYTGTPVELNTNDKISMVDKYGNEVPLAQLSEYDVASVAISKGTERSIRIIISADAIEGKINLVTTGEDGSVRIQMASEQFELTDHFQKYLEEKNLSLQAGDSGVFYLDYLGKIAAFEKGEQLGDQYAYFMKAREVGFDNAEVKLLMQDGNIRIMELAPKVNINDVTFSAAEAYEWLNGLTGGQRLMKINQNSDGTLKKITLPTSEEIGGDIMQTYDASAGTLYYKEISQCFGGKFNVDDSTIVFLVPAEATEASADDENYEVQNYKHFSNDTYYTVSTFITEQDVLVQDIVISYENVGTGSAADIQMDSRIGIVKEIAIVLDDEGIPVQSVTVLLDGKEQQYQTDDAALLEGINPGDGVRVAVNAQGTLRYVEKLFDYETRSVLSGNKANGFDNINYVFYGQVVRKDGNIIQLEGLNDAGQMEKVNILIRGNVYRIEDLRGKLNVTLGSAEDILDRKVLGDEASHVLIQSRYTDTKVVAIYD